MINQETGIKSMSKKQAVRLDKIIMGIAMPIIFVLCLAPAQADGLFNFQMKLAKKGNNPEAEFKVGESYETGFGVEKDIKEARIWIDKAAAQGHEAAGFKLLYWSIEKNGLNAENKPKFEELKAKAKVKNPQAMYYIGKMYAYGVGLNANRNKALKWLNKATLVGVLSAEREADNLARNKQKKSRSDTASGPINKKTTATASKKQKPLTAAEKKKIKKLKQAARLKAYSLLLQKEAEAEAAKEAGTK